MAQGLITVRSLAIYAGVRVSLTDHVTFQNRISKDLIDLVPPPPHSIFHLPGRCYAFMIVTCINTFMNKVNMFLKSRLAHIISSGFLGCIYIVFAYAHVSSFLKTHEITWLLFGLSETLLVFFYIFRTRPNTISVEFFD
jgi:hypothetical protein